MSPLNKRIRLFVGILLALLAITMYLVLHGTRNLLFVSKINSIKDIIPIFDGIKTKNLLLNNYAVDIIWIISFNLLVSIFDKRFYNFLVLCSAVFLEVLQLLNKKFGTFDFVDILIYTVISLSFILLMKKKET